MTSELNHVSSETLPRRALRARTLKTLHEISMWNVLAHTKLLSGALTKYNPGEPRTSIEDAMERAGRIMHDAAQDHLQAFERRMREKVGVGEIVLSEPYLPFLLAQGELEYLLRLERMEARLAPVKTVYLTIPNPENTGTPGGNGITDTIGRETFQSVLRLNQRLDSARQQSFGITHYVWEGGDCETCAANSGQIFEWGEGDEPGDVHPNCNCTADPVVESAGEPNPPEITAEDIAGAALLILSLNPLGLARKLGLAAAGRLGRVGQRILERVRRQEESTPPQKPGEPQTSIQVQKPRMNDTKTWPKPPRSGKFKEGMPSRAKPRNRGEKSLYDENGGEWRYDPGDKYHNPHWNYKPPGKAQEWQNITIDGRPHLKR